LELGMQESYGEDLASHPGLSPRADRGNAVGVAAVEREAQASHGAPKSSLSQAELVLTGRRQ
jgi:hypothetical protein